MDKWEIKKIKDITVNCKGKSNFLNIETEDGLVFIANIKKLPIKLAKIKEKK